MPTTGSGEPHEHVSARRTRRARWRLPVSPIDVKLGARMLLKHPLMTAVSVISLAVGIPVGLAPTHAFEAFEAPLPVADGDGVFALRYRSAETLQDAPATLYDFSVWRASLESFEAVYLRDELVPSVPGQTIVIAPEDLAKIGRASCRERVLS